MATRGDTREPTGHPLRQNTSPSWRVGRPAGKQPAPIREVDCGGTSVGHRCLPGLFSLTGRMDVHPRWMEIHPPAVRRRPARRDWADGQSQGKQASGGPRWSCVRPDHVQEVPRNGSIGVDQQSGRRVWVAVVETAPSIVAADAGDDRRHARIGRKQCDRPTPVYRRDLAPNTRRTYPTADEWWEPRPCSREPPWHGGNREQGRENRQRSTERVMATAPAPGVSDDRTRCVRGIRRRRGGGCRERRRRLRVRRRWGRRR